LSSPSDSSSATFGRSSISPMILNTHCRRLLE
jgi:hypothetical protein